MSKTNGLLFFLAVSILSFSPLAQADMDEAKQMVAENCLSCHGSEVYTRDDRMVHSFDSLITMVNRCNVNLNTGWFDDEVETVARYLSEHYYGF